MSNKKHDLLHRVEELPSRMYVIFAIIMLGVHIAICTYTEASPSVTGLVLLLLYAAICGTLYWLVHRRLVLYRIESNTSEEQNNSVIHAFHTSLNIPYAVVTETGRILTVNNAMRQCTGAWDTLFNSDISSICNRSMKDILHIAMEEYQNQKGDEEEDPEKMFPDYTIANTEVKNLVEIEGRTYKIDCHPLHAKGRHYYMLIFRDVTELWEITEKHQNNLTAIAYIVMDNLEELAQYVKVSYNSEARQAERLLKEWASELGGMLREYEKNKFILLLSRAMLSECIENKFEILDKIRDIRIGTENMPITISMGVATSGDSMSNRERDALVALDLALQRGGDQVVMKTELGNFFFGGKTKAQQKRTRNSSRVIAGKLCSMITESSSVLVMGHSNPDFDSIGACVGIAALCLHLGTRVKIVTDTESENFKACTSRLTRLSDYKNMFIDGVDGLSQRDHGTLLIIVDANNFAILEEPEIAKNSAQTVIIDHHITKIEKDGSGYQPQLSYIDATASSASELVSEILEQSLPERTLRQEEANVLMAGIMVDTKNFTRTVGTRTFAAALYLRNQGARTEDARVFFEEAFDDYRAEAQFGSEAKIYRDQIAITSIEGSGTQNDRVSAAKAADKLLTVRNVNAAFALICIGSTVHISARSNGTINVQIILEKIGGGGHFDVAGAALTESSLKDAESRLMEAIDNYFENNLRSKS